MAARRLQLVSPIWEAAAARGPLTTDQVMNTAGAPQPLPTEIEEEIISALEQPLSPGESHRAGSERRERAVGALLAKLDIVQAYQLGRRLDLDRSDDRVAVVFRRLVIERRQRLRAFLANARRRSAR
jgi:hypothetical protein